MDICDMDELLTQLRDALPGGIVLLLDTEEGCYDTVQEAVSAMESAWGVQIA